MTQPEGQYSPITQKVFNFLRDHADAVFLLEDLCGQTGCTPTQARLALDILLRHGVIEQVHTTSGQDAYVYRSR